MQENTKVAVIILNWNAYDDTFECLRSLEDLNYSAIHIYLADNNSADNSFGKLMEDYSRNKFNLNITFIQTGDNLGFAGGNNVAIKKAYEEGYEYFWLLNNDTIVDSNSLKALLDVLRNNTNVGIVGSKILYFDSPEEIWFAGGTVNTWTGKTSHIGLKKQDDPIYNQIKSVDYITGCSLLFNRNVIEKVGLMNEEYFLYYEETDWNLRASKYFEILYCPQSVIYHKVSSSSGGEKKPAPYIEFYDIRNAYWMVKNTQDSKLKKCVAYIYAYYKAIKKVIKIFVKNYNNKIVRLGYILRGLKEL